MFELHYVPHVLSSILAYAWSAAALTVYAASVSVMCDGIRGTGAIPFVDGAGARQEGTARTMKACRVRGLPRGAFLS